ncbi:MAG: SAF domain-containing protein [Acidimicrobiia bacterium]
MFWFRRPPYLRWFAAGSLVVAAFLIDLRKGATTPHPFARADIARGMPIEEPDVAWENVPIGLLPAPDLAGAVTARALRAGQPILPHDLGLVEPIPADWWAVPLAMPATAAPGSSVLLVLVHPPRSVPGIVVEPGSVGAFGVAEAGLVAIPGDAATAVATAATRGELTVLIEP